MMTTTAQLNYVKVNHPEVYEAMEKDLSSLPIDADVITKLAKMVDRGHYRTMYIVAASLLLFSPATIIAGSTSSRGLIDVIAEVLGVSKSAVSKRIPSVRHYYRTVGWFKDNVDRIVKDIRTT